MAPSLVSWSGVKVLTLNQNYGPALLRKSLGQLDATCRSRRQANFYNERLKLLV